MTSKRRLPTCKFDSRSAAGWKADWDRFNATQKGALAQGLFHRLVAEYLDCVYRFLSPEDASTKMHALLEA